MATIDLGKIKQVWRGTYSNANSYTADDLVQYTDNGVTSTYIALAASSNSNQQVPSTGGTATANYWAFVAKGVADPIPTQTNNSGKFLTTNGSAASWGTVSQKVIGIGSVRHTSSTSFNTSSSNLNNAGKFYYPDTAHAMLELTYNRQNSASNIIMQGHYTVDTSTNMHAFWCFIASDQSIAKNMGFDEHNFDRQYMTVSFFCMFTAAELGTFTGNKVYVAGGGSGDSRTHTGTRCPNRHSTNGDTSDIAMYSELTILEVLP